MTHPEKDIYYLQMCQIVASRSRCLSRKIGSVLVRDDTAISIGVNGPPRGVKHCNERNILFYNDLNGSAWLDKCNFLIDKCPRRYFNYKSGEGLFMCDSGHSERNALIQAARNGISTLNSTLYLNTSLPCKDCMIEIINAGVKRIVCFTGSDYDKYSRVLLEESKIQLKTYEEKEINANKN